MKKTVKLLSLTGAAAVMVTALPISTYAAEPKGQVRVIVENSTLSQENGAVWEGVLLDSTVAIDSDDNALTAFVKAVSAGGFTQTGADTGFVSDINGLSSENGGAWMATLDDWFTDEGLSAYTAQDGKLSDGDEIRFMYTMNWGADLGYDWQSIDTTLADIVFSAGTLTPDFDPAVTEYTLDLPEEVNNISVVPTASSQSFRVKTYKNDYTADQLGTDYKKGETFSVADGDTVIIGVANSAWMSYVPDGVTETVYRIAVNAKVEESSEPSEPSQQEESKPEQKQMTVDDLKSVYPAQQAVYGNEWGMITLERFGLMTEEIKSQYIANVKAYLDSLGTAKISNTRSTAVSGVMMALSGMGADIYDFYGYPLAEQLADMDYVTNQGINGAIYALMAFDTNAEYAIPKCGTNQTTREKLVAAILEAQGNDGGWTFDTGNVSDADMTGMALQALAPYRKDAKVKNAIEKALTFLSDNQKDNGGFVSYGAEDSESCSQVIAALAMLDVDIFSDTRFIKNDNTVFDALMRFYREEDNGFAHAPNGESNALSTAQAYFAVSTMYQYAYQDMTKRPVVNEPSVAPVKEQASQTISEQSSTVLPSSPAVPTGDAQNFVLLFGTTLLSAAVIPMLRKRKT